MILYYADDRIICRNAQLVPTETVVGTYFDDLINIPHPPPRGHFNPRTTFSDNNFVRQWLAHGGL